MRNLKKFLLLLLFPKIWITLLLVPLSAAMLIYAFAGKNPNSILVYVSYGVSAYTLTVVCASSPVLFRKIKELKNSNRFMKRYFSDADYKAAVNLNIGLALNTGYSVFKFVSGFIYSSFWFGAEAVYYIVLSVIRFSLVKRLKIKNKTDSRKVFRLCGILLLILNTAMSGIIIQILFQNETYLYPGFVIYATAAFTFWRLISSIVELFKKSKSNLSAVSAAKFVNLSASLMSLFALQTAMLSQFNSEGLSSDIMNTATGIAVSASVMSVAVYMIIRGNKNEIKEEI